MTIAPDSPASVILVDPPPSDDPPPPYPSRERRARSSRRLSRRLQSTQLSSPEPIPDSEHDHPPAHSPPSRVLLRPFPPSDDASETTPLLAPSNASLISSTRRLTRPRSASHTSTVLSSSSAAPSLAQTVLSLFRADVDDSSDVDDYDLLAGEQRDDARAPTHGSHVHTGRDYVLPEYQHRESGRHPLLFSRRAWARYFRPVFKRAYYAAVFHLMVLNFPYALAAWIYLFIFTLTGTTLLMALPLGAVLCFFDLIGARAFARGELALQSTFHGPLAYPLPYPARPIFTRQRPATPAEVESGAATGTKYETSFYKNAYAMFTDPTSYQALFYFLVIKPGITLLVSLILVVFVPVAFVLVLPAPLVLRAVRRLGVWQANVAVEGLFLAMS
ncbi:hypothetical protein SERLA73DRAFT_168201 [Serpula lacrymans var. lacrymans S7.3]|uniref:Sensor domain-containing protein n=2 Tax=Serpula lacrymans var. lacrymans TaxID=341189 RepID=F8PUQ9_SERL3|nr:uncharacterized protein SERLADRAFT_448903 [Serpula lacrymans var. lacrymans S7.9]EGO00467.1 hypothetical protein SERLA73DRAFT_168201 [Serpula lacrymans var. lacrymans S7.3]EGO26018.1 hypothetical protein SERLADRAFT_448903 [Serpula lacrymans var. lacrymans S7.9]